MVNILPPKVGARPARARGTKRALSRSSYVMSVTFSSDSTRWIGMIAQAPGAP